MSRRSLAAGRLIVLVAIVLSALTLRTAVTSITPLLDEIGAEIGFNSTVTGVFGMLPTAMFAVFGILTPRFALRFGLERVALAAMVMTAIGIATRSAMSGTLGLLLFSALALGGMGIGNVVIPPLVKRYFSDRLAVVSTVYITCVQIGTMLPALVAVPLADAFGWRTSLGVWALLPVAAALPWIGVIASRRGRDRSDVTAEETAASGEPVGQAWRSPVAWGMAGMFGMTSLITYSMFTWIPKILTEAGASTGFGGTMVALFSAVGFIAAIGAPSLCTRIANPFPVVLGCVVCYLVGFGGLLFAPMAAPVAWIIAIGLGPSTFPMSLTLINLRTRTGAGSAALSGFTQGLGYAVACIGPLLFGVLHDATDGWTWPFALLLVAVAVMTVGAYQACKPRYLEDSWGARHTG
ncbi:MFS transporter [Rhodococcus spelaei]|uniref:MFS transporter n=1 Tax=Rhodococcus spelaei TaxID=2546320 RepID=A0A541B1D7_9NOCA|nr:MFS transporter [Rhodococcus spelaei]TQF66133.1 MFS transporter [Rhodococcus spelaei]